jgi:GAF domain-containing protein
MFVTMLCAQGRRIPIRASIWRLPGRNEFLLIHHVVEHLQDRLDMLYAITAAVSGTLELDPLMDNVLREVSRLIPCNVSTLHILEQDGSFQVRRWHEGRFEDYRSIVRERQSEFETRRIMRETGRPVIVYDCDTDPRWVKPPDFRPIRSWLGAPLIHHGEFLGEIDLDSAEPNAFTEEDAELVQALASQVAAALHNVRQFESEQRRAQRNQAIGEVSQAISRLELRSVLEVVYQKVSGLMDASTFFIGLYDAEAEQVSIVGSYERGKPLADEVRGADLGLTGLVIGTRQSIIIHDSQREPVPASVIVEGEMPRSMLMFPLITQDEIVGMISVQSYEPNAYSPDDIELLETIAGAIATTVSNAQLYDRALERLTALETLHQLSLVLAAVQNPDAIAELVTRTALQLFGPGEVRLHLYDGTAWNSSTWVGHATGDPDHPRVLTRDRIVPGSLVKQVGETRRPVVLHDLSRQPDLQTEFRTPWLVQAVAIYPIIRSGDLFAALSLLYGEPYFFRGDRLRALELLCTQAATALENARYMLTLRRRLDEVTALQDLARQVSSSYTLDDIFDVVVHTLQDVYQCRARGSRCAMSRARKSP